MILAAVWQHCQKVFGVQFQEGETFLHVILAHVRPAGPRRGEGADLLQDLTSTDQPPSHAASGAMQVIKPHVNHVSSSLCA
jgi:hypothetical protein